VWVCVCVFYFTPPCLQRWTCSSNLLVAWRVEKSGLLANCVYVRVYVCLSGGGGGCVCMFVFLCVYLCFTPPCLQIWPCSSTSLVARFLFFVCSSAHHACFSARFLRQLGSKWLTKMVNLPADKRKCDSLFCKFAHVVYSRRSSKLSTTCHHGLLMEGNRSACRKMQARLDYSLFDYSLLPSCLIILCYLLVSFHAGAEARH